MSAHSLRGSVRCGPSPGARSLGVVLRSLPVARLVERPAAGPGSGGRGPSPGARSLVVVLRYLHVAGLIELPLEWAVPGVADLRDRSLLRGLEPVVVKKLLASCDRRRTVGRREYAILWLRALPGGETA